MKKKLVIMLVILMILSIAIGVSPIVDYFYAHGAEAPKTSDTQALTSVSQNTAPDSTTPHSTTPDSTDDRTSRQPNDTAILSAVILSTGTILIALVLFIKRRNPDT